MPTWPRVDGGKTRLDRQQSLNANKRFATCDETIVIAKLRVAVSRRSANAANFSKRSCTRTIRICGMVIRSSLSSIRRTSARSVTAVTRVSCVTCVGSLRLHQVRQTNPLPLRKFVFHCATRAIIPRIGSARRLGRSGGIRRRAHTRAQPNLARRRSRGSHSPFAPNRHGWDTRPESTAGNRTQRNRTGPIYPVAAIKRHIARDGLACEIWRYFLCLTASRTARQHCCLRSTDATRYKLVICKVADFQCSQKSSRAFSFAPTRLILLL